MQKYFQCDACLAAFAATPEQISEEDFVEHYSDVSFSVPSDAEFRQLVMNCWGLDGCSDNVPVRTSGDDIANEKNDSRQARPVPTRLRYFAVTYADGSYATKELLFPSEVRTTAQSRME